MHLFPLMLLAAAFWGQTPACGTPTITSAELRPPVVGLANTGTCTITLTTNREWEAGEACMTTVHEYGHLLGMPHSSNPESLMYPVIRRPAWPCKW